MNISGYSIAGSISGYKAQNASQTNAKPFTIPTQNIELKPIGPITFIGYGKFDPFKDIARTGSFNMPEYMQTKTEPKRSDAEILKDMEELAKEHAKTGLRRDDDYRFAKIIDEYISSVSPDREGILRSKISEILERMNSEISGMEDLKDKDDKKDPIDYFLEMLKNKGKVIASRSDGYYTQIDIDRGEGKITTLTYDKSGALQPYIGMKGDMYDNVLVENNVVKYANFYDDNGEKIMSYDSNNFGLLQAYTKAEGARSQEIVAAYNAAYDLAKAA